MTIDYNKTEKYLQAKKIKTLYTKKMRKVEDNE